MTAQIYEFPHPQDREGRQPGARRSPLRSTDAPKCRRPVSFEAWRYAMGAAKGVQQHVLVGLADFHNKDTGRCDPSIAEVAELTGLGATTIRRAIRQLEAAGLLIVNGTLGGRQQHARYVFPAPKVKADTRPERPSKHRKKVGRSGAESRPERSPETVETRPLRSQNSAAPADVVLRTRTGTSESGTTSAAAASADEQAELFEVDHPAPVMAAREIAILGRKELAQANAGHAVAAWCEGYADTHDAKPTARQIGQVGRESRQLFEAGNPPERVVYAARCAGGRGLATIEKEYNALAKRRDVPQPAAHPAPARPSTTDSRVAAGIALAAKYAQQEAG